MDSRKFRHGPYKSLSAAISWAAAMLFVSLSMAQEAPKNDFPPRTSWGAVDLGGMWDFRTIVPIERPEEHADRKELSGDELRALLVKRWGALTLDTRLEDPVADVEFGHNEIYDDWGKFLDDDLRSSLLVDPSNGRLPRLTAKEERRLAELKAKPSGPIRHKTSRYEHPMSYYPAGPEELGLAERCIIGINTGPPMRGGKANNLLRIIQTEDYVVLLTEEIHDARIVPLDGREHLPADISLWQGEPRGTWDNDTLIVETRNFTNRVAAFYHPRHGPVGVGSTLRLVERFRLLAPDRLLYEYTIDDPETFVSSFTVAQPMRATEQRMYEFACHEGNYSVLNSLRGARWIESNGLPNEQ